MTIKDVAKVGKDIYDQTKEGLPVGANLIEAAAWAVPYVGLSMSLLNALVPGEPQLTIGDVLNALQDRMDEIDRKLAELGALLKEMGRLEDDQELQRDLQDIMSQVRGALQAARDWDSKRDDDILKGVAESAAAQMIGVMDHFLRDNYFMRVYVEEFLYHYRLRIGDRTQQVMKPDDCPQGEVGAIWDYGWMLPAFLEAIISRLIVLQILWPEDYHTRFIERPEVRREILKYADRLWDIHNRIRAGIKEIPYVFLKAGIYTSSDQFPALPCGAVECYSATASTTPHFDAWQEVYALPWDYIPPPDVRVVNFSTWVNENKPYWDRIAFRWKIRAHQKKVELYREVGLFSIWDTTNSLRTLIEQPPLKLSEHAREEGFSELRRFSVRTFVSLMPESMTSGLEAEQPIRLRELKAMLKSPPPFSLRQMLMFAK